MIVIDTSIVIKWLNPEKDSDKAISLLTNYRKGEEDIMIPPLLSIEVANVLATKSTASEEGIKEGLQFLFSLQLKIYPPTEDILLETTLLAKQHKTSVYDMLYAVIAEKTGSTLFTADERFVGKCRFSHVQLLKDYKI